MLSNGDWRLRVLVIGQLTQPFFLYMMLLYPCCGRLTAALRGPNIIKLLCSFALTRGFAGAWSATRKGLLDTYAAYPRVTLRSPAVKYM